MMPFDVPWKVWWWGEGCPSGAFGATGAGASAAQNTPVQISLLKPIRRVAGGVHTSGVVDEHGTLFVWGSLMKCVRLRGRILKVNDTNKIVPTEFCVKAWKGGGGTSASHRRQMTAAWKREHCLGVSSITSPIFLHIFPEKNPTAFPWRQLKCPTWTSDSLVLASENSMQQQ